MIVQNYVDSVCICSDVLPSLRWPPQINNLVTRMYIENSVLTSCGTGLEKRDD